MSEPANELRSILAQWSRLSLRAKGVAVLAVPLAALFIAMLSAFLVEGTARESDALLTKSYETRSELQQLRISLLEAETAGSGSPAARSAVGQSLDRVAALGNQDAAGAAILGEVRKGIAEELQLLEQQPQTPAADRTRLLGRVRQLSAETASRLEVLNRAQNVTLERARSDREAARRHLFRILMLCGILGPLGALFAHLLIAGRLVRRLGRVEENARRLAHGLPLEPFQSGTDEIADLARQLEDAAYLLSDRERELRESEQRYRDLFDQAPVAYEETDLDGSIRRYNQAVCLLLKVTPDQMMGRFAWDFVAPDQQDQVRTAMLERIARGTETGPFECEYLLDDGSGIRVEIRENFIRNAHGKITGVLRSLTDVTERNLAEVAARKVKQYAMELTSKNEQLARALAAARSATEAKSRFLAGISHELRTPLNGIIGFAEIMHDGRVGPVSEEHREFLGDILTSSRHLLRLINDILDLSKIEAGKMEFQPEPRLIDTLVQEVRDVIRPLAERKHIQVTTEVPAEFTARVDAARFKQVLYNFLSNAVKFTPSGGRVSLRVTVERERFRVDVEDTGIGIEPSEMGRLFEEFQQLPNSRTAEQGTGLGLALTRHIVEAQGGQVSARSAVGKGSVFSAVLPLNESSESVSAPGR